MKRRSQVRRGAQRGGGGDGQEAGAAQSALKIREAASMLSVSVDIENLDPEVRPMMEWIEACRQEGKEIDCLEGARWFEGDAGLVQKLLKACVMALDQGPRLKPKS
jgi:hypothetical protein